MPVSGKKGSSSSAGAAVSAATRPTGVFGPQSLIAAIAAITALYFGRDVFVPVALAVLLTFLLSPIVSLLRRWRIPRTLAVVSVVAMAMFTIFVFGLIVAGQLTSLASNLPSYQYNIQNKIRDIKQTDVGSGTFDRAARVLESLEQEIQEAEDEEEAAADDEPEPMPVRIEETERSPLEVLQTLILPMLAPLATGGIVIVFVIFMLLRREDLRDRFIRLAGAGDLHRTTNALQDAGRRVGQYLLMQLIVNVTYAVPITAGLWFIGVPNALLWGLLALVLRFVPYVGPIIAAFFPLTLAFAVDPGWTMLLWTAALIITIELISNNLIEPWLYGSRTGLSPVAIIVAAIFWTWLWGPIGLILSTPLTVCFVVLGRHVPQFEFLDILLGDRPVLAPHERMYQRLLAGDPDEATEQAETYLKTRPVLDFYDDVAIPALALVEQDRVRGVLGEQQRQTVADGAMELVENLADHEDVDEEEFDDEDLEEREEREAMEEREPRRRRAAAAENLPPPKIRPGRVMCAGARGNLDDAAAVMLADALRRMDVPVTTAPHETLQAAALRGFDFEGISTVVVGYLNSESLAHARYLVRRLRRVREDMTVIIAFWSLADDEDRRKEVAEAVRADGVVVTVDELAEWLEPAVERKEEALATEREEKEAGGLLEPAPAL